MKKIIVALALAALATLAFVKLDHLGNLDKVARSLPASVKEQAKSVDVQKKIPVKKINRHLAKTSKHLSKSILANQKDTKKLVKELSKTAAKKQRIASKYIKSL